MRLFTTLVAVAAVSAQDSSTFVSDVNVVNVLAVVRDKSQIVTNLNRDDFTIFEDEHPQTIRYFSRESDLPLTIGLMVDTSMSQTGVIGEERSAAYAFLDQILRPEKDRAFVIQFDYESTLMQDMTSSRPKLHAALDQVRVPQDRHLGTVMRDAIFLASGEIMRPERGRKVLILLTDGQDVGSRTSLTGAIRSAQQSDTLVYSIWFADPALQKLIRRKTIASFPGQRVLRQISAETGGRYFEVSDKLPIGKIFAAIEEELRSEYSIGYVSDPPADPNRFHQIKLLTKMVGLTVQSRAGYFPNTQ